MVSDIPYLVLENKCHMLNVKSTVGSDFRRLAGELGMKTSNVRLLSQNDNPTDKVLKWWEPQISATVNKFCKRLIRMERHDVLEILNGDKQPQENHAGKKYSEKLKFRLAQSPSGNFLYIIYTHINIFRTWLYTNRVTSGGLRGGGHFGQVPGARRFRGPRRYFGPCGCLWRHVFRDRTARFWADILYMYRGAGAPCFNIKYESRTFFVIRHNSISCCSCCDQSHDNDNITQLCFLNSESREETDQTIFVANSGIDSFCKCGPKFSNAWCDNMKFLN